MESNDKEKTLLASQLQYNNTDVNVLVNIWNGAKLIRLQGHKHHCHGKTYLSLFLMNSTRATAIVVEHKTDTNPVTMNDVLETLLLVAAPAASAVKAWKPKRVKSSELTVSERRRT